MTVDASLEKYIQTEIFPKYNLLDEGHGVDHIEYVIRRSLDLSEHYQTNKNMAYTIAAFHDLGNIVKREGHEAISAEMLANDSFIKDFFTTDEIRTMYEAVKTHRASYAGDYDSIYGKIVSQADRNFDADLIITRTIHFSLKHFPDFSEEEHYLRVFNHVKDKYGENGYARIVLTFNEDEKKLEKLRSLLSQEDKFKKLYDHYYEKIS